MSSTQNEEALKGFDCLMVCLQLAMSWDEKMLKKLFKKHGLLKENPHFDSAFALYQLHHEFHDPESGIARDLIRFFNREYKYEIAKAAEMRSEENAPSLLEPTTEFLKQNPAGAFWALATDERMDIHSLSTYHAHRLLLESFRASSGSVFAFEKMKDQVSSFKKENSTLREEAAELRTKTSALERENERLRRELSDADARKRELRMLRYELEKAASGPVVERLKETKTDSSENLLMVDVDSPCPFKNSECKEKKRGGRCSLENVKVALVGGLERLENQYRHVFESLGTEKFYFHSGCCDGGGAERLRTTTEAADIVVFITRVNSHNALNVLKGVCKKSGKSFLAVRETGPEQVSRIVLNSLLPAEEKKEDIKC